MPTTSKPKCRPFFDRHWSGSKEDHRRVDPRVAKPAIVGRRQRRDGAVRMSCEDDPFRIDQSA
jgi:hypothetical protein